MSLCVNVYIFSMDEYFTFYELNDELKRIYGIIDELDLVIHGKKRLN